MVEHTGSVAWPRHKSIFIEVPNGTGLLRIELGAVQHRAIVDETLWARGPGRGPNLTASSTVEAPTPGTWELMFRPSEQRPASIAAGRVSAYTVEAAAIMAEVEVVTAWEGGAPLLPPNLIDSLARYTEIGVASKGVNVPLGSEQIFEYPFVWLTGHLPVRFSDAERRNLTRYVERGGLIVFDDHDHDIEGIFHKTATEEIERAFGADALIELPNDHELYHCFFEFEDGPPTTSHELNGWGDDLVHEHLHAVLRGDRIGLLYSSKDYSSEWNFHPDTKRFMSVDPTRFGVNMMVYALTR